jgi:hypothetical protein
MNAPFRNLGVGDFAVSIAWLDADDKRAVSYATRHFREDVMPKVPSSWAKGIRSALSVV